MTANLQGHLRLGKDGMKFGQGPTLVAKFLKENEVKGSSREELEIILLMGGQWD